MSTIDKKRELLLEQIAGYDSCAVAFSGGVDSAVVANAAWLALGERALAVTGISASLPEGELEAAQKLAKLIGIRHIVLSTDELSHASYSANAPDRCYHCKSELYTQMSRHLAQWSTAVIANGTNADDLTDYRPGIEAARKYHVVSPLADCGITKVEVRELAASWHLPVADKPASPCLSSRIAYGQEVTPQRLQMIDRAEQLVRSLGLTNVRVRYHAGDLARVEVPAAVISRLTQDSARERLVEGLRRLGFKYVTLDLEGFRSGSLNPVIPSEHVTRLSGGAGD
jgi:uncharacterized protein